MRLLDKEPAEEPAADEEEPAPADDEEGGEVSSGTKDFNMHAFQMTYPQCDVPTVPETDYDGMWARLCEEQGAAIEDWTQPPYQGALKFMLESFYRKYNPAGIEKADVIRGNIMNGVKLEMFIEKMCEVYSKEGLPAWSGDFPSALRHPDHVRRAVDAFYALNDPENYQALEGDVAQVLSEEVVYEDKIAELVEKYSADPEDWKGCVPRAVAKYTIECLMQDYNAHDEQRVSDLIGDITSGGGKSLDAVLTELCQEFGADPAAWRFYPVAMRRKKWIERFFQYSEIENPGDEKIEELSAREEELVDTLKMLCVQARLPYEEYWYFLMQVSFTRQQREEDYLRTITEFLQQHAADKVDSAAALAAEAVDVGDDIWGKVVQFAGVGKMSQPLSYLPGSPRPEYLAVRYALDAFAMENCPDQLAETDASAQRVLLSGNPVKELNSALKAMCDKYKKKIKDWEVKDLARASQGALSVHFGEMYKNYAPKDAKKAKDDVKKVMKGKKARDQAVQELLAKWKQSPETMGLWAGVYPLGLRRNW